MNREAMVKKPPKTATLGVETINCITYGSCCQRVVTGLKPSFSVGFSVNEGCFVSNKGVVKSDIC